MIWLWNSVHYRNSYTPNYFKIFCLFFIIIVITDISDQVKHALGNITEGLCHPLKSRIEHIVAEEAPATVLYSVMTLIRFYRGIIAGFVPESVLVTTLDELLELSEKSFSSRLQRETRAALGERAEPPGQDLVPAASVARLLSLLNDVLSVASIVRGEDREKDMLRVSEFMNWTDW